MQFLYVAERELRVAARKRSSFRVRMLASGTALFVSGFALWFVTLFGNRPMSGEQLFYWLSWLSFILACVMGPVLTADCVNEERSEGTLGLLFLTNLHSVSISLGKLAGHGLLALYSIISVVPVMALPALLGGADVESLVKTTLVLVVTLLLSLVVGMLASTICLKPWRAAALALCLLGILTLGIPVTSNVLRFYQRVEVATALELFSPSYSLLMAGPSAAMLPSNRLSLALALQAFVASCVFVLINLLLPRAYKEGTTGKTAGYFSSVRQTFKFGAGDGRRRLRTRLLEVTPVLWLSCRERFGAMSPAVLMLSLAFLISQEGKHFFRQAPTEFVRPMIAWIIGMPLLYILFCLRLAAAASERFAVDRKTGALDLIVCTPLKTREIIRGHWLGMVRRLWGAAVVLLALHAFVLNYIMEAIRIESTDPALPHFGLRELIVGSAKHLFGAAVIPNSVAPFYIASLAVLTAAVLIVILWMALGWLGMALSLKLRREILAPWIGLILLAVPPLPLFICALPLLNDQKLFASNLFLAMLRAGMTGFFIVLANALIWLVVARRWTYKELRVAAPSSTARSIFCRGGRSLSPKRLSA